MNAILTLAAKDLRLLLRDRMGLFFIVVFPVIYGVFFGSMFGGGGGSSAKLNIAVADEDDTPASHRFVKDLDKSGSVALTSSTRDEAMESVRLGKQTAFVAIPKGFGASAGVPWGKSPALDVGIDPARKAEAGMLQGLIMQALFERMKDQFTNPAELRKQIAQVRKDIDGSTDMAAPQRIVLSTFMASLDQFLGSVDTKTYQNGPQMEPAKINTIDVTVAKSPVQQELAKLRSPYEISFPSAMLWGVMGSLAGFAVSLVKERSEGTYLRLKTAPITRAQILGGKAAACFTCSMGVMAFMLLLGRVGFGVRLSNPLGLAAATLCIAACFVGLMMIMSVIGKTEAAVGGATWAMLTVLAMIGGGMIPLAFMPEFMKKISDVSPVKWSILALEGAIWRGFSFREMATPCMILLAIGAVAFAIGATLLKRSEA